MTERQIDMSAGDKTYRQTDNFMTKRDNGMTATPSAMCGTPICLSLTPIDSNGAQHLVFLP